MSRVGCPEEDGQQSQHSPGTVSGGEMMVFALIYPEQASEGSLALFEKGKMKTRSVSICRASHATHQHLMDQVVTPLLASNPARRFLGYQVATCAEIREIRIPTNSGEDTEFGAICVIDDGYEDYVGHARMGFSAHDPEFWKKNNREAARGNLALTLKRRGTFVGAADWPA